MKVKCLKLFNDTAKQYVDKSSWITIGKEYVVLAIDISPVADISKISYRLRSDQNGMPGLFDASQFEIISGIIPSNWTIGKYGDNGLVFGPKTWKEFGFWERLFDGDDLALELYKQEAKIICEEEDCY